MPVCFVHCLKNCNFQINGFLVYSFICGYFRLFLDGETRRVIAIYKVAICAQMAKTIVSWLRVSHSCNWLKWPNIGCIFS